MPADGVGGLGGDIAGAAEIEAVEVQPGGDSGPPMADLPLDAGFDRQARGGGDLVDRLRQTDAELFVSARGGVVDGGGNLGRVETAQIWRAGGVQAEVFDDAGGGG